MNKNLCFLSSEARPPNNKLAFISNTELALNVNNVKMEMEWITWLSAICHL